MKTDLYFNMIISICINNYIEFLISSYLSLGNSEPKLYGETFAYIIAIECFLISIVFMPMIYIWIHFRKINEIRN